jgi:hypothetical protein
MTANVLNNPSLNPTASDGASESDFDRMLVLAGIGRALQQFGMRQQ